LKGLRQKVRSFSLVVLHHPVFVSSYPFFAEKSVAISDVSLADYNRLLRECRLVIASATFPESYGGTEVPAFQWSDETEPQQEDRYLGYLAQIVPLTKRNLRWKSIRNRTDLFQGKVPGYKLTGTADVAIIDTTFPQYDSSLIRASLALIVELKPKFESDSFRQGVLELLAHSSMGETAWHPLALVTDLNDEWCFLWLNDGRKITVLSGTRAQSVKFLRDLFNSNEHTVPGFEQFNQRGGLRLDLQIHSGMGATDVANLDDVMECMTEDELRMHKSQVKFNMYLQANPWLSSMYS